MVIDTFKSFHEDAHQDEDERYYAWSDALSCGHDGVDSDHRRIFAMAERLRTADLRGHGTAVVAQLLDELMDYVHEHFSREEALMKAIDYPDFVDHQFEHGLLIQRVQSLHLEFSESKHLSHKEMWQFLRRWLRYHILHADAEMARFALMTEQQADTKA